MIAFRVAVSFAALPALVAACNSTAASDVGRTSDAGAPCASSHDCASGEGCAYLIAAGCDASGTCEPLSGCNGDYVALCACNGETTQVFCGPPGGPSHAVAPVRSAGPCLGDAGSEPTDSGDAGKG